MKSIIDLVGSKKSLIDLVISNDLKNVKKKLSMKDASVLDDRDGERNTALLIACENRYYAMICLLIESGADVFAKNAKNQSALILFVKGKREIAQEPFLSSIDEYASILTTGYVNVLTAGRGLGIAAFVATQDYAGVIKDVTSERKAIINLLIEKGISLHEQDSDQQTALDYAIKFEDEFFISALKYHLLNGAIAPVDSPEEAFSF